MKNTLSQAFLGPFPERSITCIIASIYDVDEESDIVYVNTEDIAFMIPHGNIESVSIIAPLVARLVTESERSLGLLDSEVRPGITSHSAEANTENQHEVAGKSTLLVEEGSEIQEKTSDMSEEAYIQTEPPAKAGKILSASEDLGLARVKARDEDGRLSIDMHEEHYMFACVELSEDQTWCLD
jgi:hypothetical protein